MKVKFKKAKNISIVISFVFILFVGWYSYRLISADLVTNWSTSGGFIGRGRSKYYVINSKNGSKTYIPSFLLPLIGYDSKKTQEDNEIWEEKISKLNPEFAYRTYISGPLNESTIIFMVSKREMEKGYDIYSYDIKTNYYNFLMHDDKLMRCVAGNGKIFYRLRVIDEGTTNELTDAIYRLSDSGEKKIVGEYKTKGRDLSLEKILK